MPIKWLGVGEGSDDLEAFDAQAFVGALLENSTPNSEQALDTKVVSQ
ncbi:MAG: hypothetical protein ACOYEO_06955 [bacterium]